LTVVTQKFDRKSRLLTAKDYARVFENPIRSSDNCFTLLARKRDGGEPRLGLAVSKKNAKLAVERNRIKRLTRESFRTRKNELQGLDIVVMNRRQTAQQDNRTLALSLSRHWQKLASLCADSLS
jgi:ribonuclease P protein component